MMVKEGYKEVKTLGKDYIIPEEWSLVELNEVLTVIRNGSSKKQNQQKRGLPISRIETISDGIINYEKVGYLDIEPEELKKHKLKKGDILFSHINSVAHIGKVAQYEAEKPLYHGMNLLKLRFDNQKVKDKFMLYRLKSKNAKQFYERYAKQAVNQASLNQNDVGLYPFPLPPQKEQKKIASILSTVDENIEKTDQVIEKTKELKKGLMQQLMTKGIGHDEFKEVRIGPKDIYIPLEWENKKIEDIVDVIKGHSYKSKYYTDESDDEGKIFINLKSINKFGGFNKDGIKFYKEQIKEKKKVKPGEVIIANTDLNRDAEVVGYPIYVPEFNDDKEICISMDVSVLRIKNGDISERYFYYSLLSKIIHDAVKAFAEGSTVLHLDIDSFKSIKIPLPPLEEQKKIANILSTVDEKIQKEEKYKAKLEELKKGLMQKLLTGEVRVKVAN